jgi:hypothetical protein
VAGIPAVVPETVSPYATWGVFVDDAAKPVPPQNQAADRSRERIKRRPVLGGLTSEYERVA